eukprot:2247469-Amphidinium_carterae.1
MSWNSVHFVRTSHAAGWLWWPHSYEAGMALSKGPPLTGARSPEAEPQETTLPHHQGFSEPAHPTSTTT